MTSRSVVGRTCGGLALACGFLVCADLNGREMADEGFKPFLAESDARKLIDDIAKLLKGEDGKDDNSVRKIRDAAVLVALATQNTKDAKDAKQLAAIRDAAVKLATAAAKKNAADLKSGIEALQKPGDIKPDDKTDPKPIDLTKHFDDVNEVMHLFGPVKKGGQGLEKDMIDLAARKKGYSQSEKDKLVAVLQMTALFAELTASHNSMAKNGKAKADWKSWSEDMRNASIETIDAVRAMKSDRDVKKSLEKVNNACSACHADHRN